MISDTSRKNYETLKGAFLNRDTAIMECTRQSNGKPVLILGAILFDGKTYNFTPFCEMIEGDPFEIYDPPQ